MKHHEGFVLRGMRDAAELTLAEVSDAAGISESMLSRVETGERRIGRETLAKVIRAISAGFADRDRREAQAKIDQVAECQKRITEAKREIQRLEEYVRNLARAQAEVMQKAKQRVPDHVEIAPELTALADDRIAELMAR